MHMLVNRSGLGLWREVVRLGYAESSLSSRVGNSSGLGLWRRRLVTAQDWICGGGGRVTLSLGLWSGWSGHAESSLSSRAGQLQGWFSLGNKSVQFPPFLPVSLWPFPPLLSLCLLLPINLSSIYHLLTFRAQSGLHSAANYFLQIQYHLMDSYASP